jgi:hypothetical protein
MKKIKNSNEVINIILTKFKNKEKDFKKEKIKLYVKDIISRIKGLASDELNSGLSEIYKKGISYRITQDSAVISLNGVIPNEIEKGKGAFDMKPLILKGRDRVVVPLTAKVKNLTPVSKDTFMKSIAPVRKKVRKDGIENRFFSAYNRPQTNITYKKAGRGLAVAFRTISNKSPKLSWINKGFKKNNFMKRAISGTLSKNRHLTVDLLK